MHASNENPINLKGQLHNQEKILIIASMGSRPYLGGIENVIDTLIHSRLHEKYEFSIFDTYRKPDPKRRFVKKIFFAVVLPFRCTYSVKKTQSKVAHIHFCSKTDFWKHSLCLFACKALKIKTIFHLHGGSFDTIYSQYSPALQKVVKFILRQPDIVVALSEYWKTFLSEISSKEKIRILPNPIDCQKLSSYSKNSAEKLSSSVVLLGSLGKRKGHFDVLDAIPLVLKENPDVQFYFAGLDEDFRATEELKAIAVKNNIANNTNFIGPITGDKKLKLLGESGIIILPSYGENMPISVLEGMAAKKSVITTRVGAIPEVIVDNKSGMLISPGDVDGLALKINHLFANPSFAFQLGNNAYMRVKDNWDVDKIALQVDQLYKEVLS